MDNEGPVIEAYEAAGYEVLRNGWPDLAVCKEGKVKFIEIKGCTDKMSEKQKAMHKLLAQVGIKVEIVKPYCEYDFRTEKTRLKYLVFEPHTGALSKPNYTWWRQNMLNGKHKQCQSPETGENKV